MRYDCTVIDIVFAERSARSLSVVAVVEWRITRIVWLVMRRGTVYIDVEHESRQVDLFSGSPRR